MNSCSTTENDTDGSVGLAILQIFRLRPVPCFLRLNLSALHQLPVGLWEAGSVAILDLKCKPVPREER